MNIKPEIKVLKIVKDLSS